MAKVKPTRDKIEGGFAALTLEMLNSKAYKHLPASAAKVLPYFIVKVKTHGSNNPARYSESFEFPYSEAKRYGFGRSTFFKMLGDLTCHGFIDVVSHGGLRSQGGHANSLFRLSKRWQSYGDACFSDGDWQRHFANKSQVLKMDCTSPENGLTGAKRSRLEAK
jgi:hypothetical protein